MECQKPDLRIGPGHPIVERVAEELLPLAEKLVEQILNRLQGDNVLTLHHLPGGHPPTPVLVIVILEDGAKWELHLVNPLREHDRRLSGFRTGRRGDDIRVSVAEVRIERADCEHPGASEQVGTEPLLDRCRMRERSRMGHDRPRPSDIFREVLKGSGWHGRSPKIAGR